MDNTALILIITTNVFLVIILGFLAFLIYRLFKQNNNVPKELQGQNFHPAALERIKEIGKLKPKRLDLFCPNHPEEPGETLCAICDKLYCRQCIKPYKSMHLCKEHLPLVMTNDWHEVITIKTSTTDPEHGVRLFDEKKVLFERDHIPTYVETHYKINVDQDYIETYLVLYSLEENLVDLKLKMANV
jgi:hypothetical protein